MRDSIGVGAIAALAPFGACLGWLGWVAGVVGLGVMLVVVLAAVLVFRQPHASRRALIWARVPIATCAACGLVAALLTAGLRS
jgi:hypothetical protein